jgi:hypothetical protein
MSEQERQCFGIFLQWIKELEFVQAAEKDREESQVFVKAEVERLEGYLATIRDELDKLKARLQ